MKRKIVYVLSFSTILILLIILFVSKKEETFNVESKSIKKENIISIMLETDEGSQEYTSSSLSTWPTDGYKFNEERSGCENGSILSWDDTKKVVVMDGDISDKCYVYFDIYVISLKDYVISQYTGTQGDNDIYYHDSSLANGAGDNSYRYAGANPNNFVCFGSDASTCPDDNLYRIIGVIDDKVKLIKYDYANSNLLGTDGDYDTYMFFKSNFSNYKGKLKGVNTYYWNISRLNIWSTSLLNKTNLNTNYINNIGASWANKIETTTWKVGGNIWENIGTATPSTAYKNEITTPAESTTYDAKIGLMYVSDYGFAASPSAWTTNLSSYNSSSVTSINWMYMGIYEWTISCDLDYSDGVFRVHEDGHVNAGTADENRTVRPSFNLISSISYVSGSGTESDPIRLS